MGSSRNIVSCFVFDQEGRLLLLQRHRDDWGGGLWATPAGGIDEGETPEAAMLRELYEETGLVITDIEYLGKHRVTMPHGSVDMMTYKTHVAASGDIVLRPDEHEACRWFVVDSLLDEAGIIWATPSILRDFGLMTDFKVDPTLADGTTVVLLEE